MTDAVEMRNLTKRFRLRTGWLRCRTVAALEGVSFSVRAGESFGLFGPNGSGKSTLLRILSTVLLPTAGQARIHGVPVSDVRRIKPLIGVIPTDPKGFAGRLTGRQNLEFFAVLQGLEPSRIPPRIDELLSRTGVAELGDQPLWTYSTGQRQRLNIARGLLRDAPLLLMDEPTRGLDPSAAKELCRWIRQELVVREGKTALIATNRPEDVRALCDRMALLERGRLVREGVPEG